MKRFATLLSALFFIALPALQAVNPPGSSCSNGCKECCEGSESGSGTGGVPNTPVDKSIYWGINVGLARYPKPQNFTNFAQTAFEINGNLPNFREIYQRYFSSNPMQQRQIHLELYQRQISAALFHPSVLFLQSEALINIRKKPAANGFPEYIHQIVTDDAFTHIDILPAPASGWRLRVWKRDAAPLTTSGSYFSVSEFENLPALADITFRRPTGSSDHNTLIYIQKETTGVSGTRTITNEIVQTLDSNQKPATVVSKIFSGEGTAGPLLSQQNISYVNRGPKIWDYTIIRETLTSTLSANGNTGALVLTNKTREVYQDFSTNPVGGELGMQRLMSHTEAFNVAGQTPQTTTYQYHQEPGNPITHGRLESRIEPDGSWTFMEYAINPSAPIALITEYQGWKDLPISQRANARKTVTQIGPNEALTEEYVENILISKSKITLGTISGNPTIVSSSWDGAGWHNTTTAFFADSAAAPSTGRIAWMENSDGTATTFAYSNDANGQLVVTSKQGAGNRDGISAGTATTTTYNLGNFAISEITKDIATNLTIQQWDTHVGYNGGFDRLGRPIKRVYNCDPNDYDISQYACCGLEYSRDRMGAVTQYYRDGLKRVYKVVNKATEVSPEISTFTAINGLTTTTTRTFDGSNEQFLGSTTRSLDGLTTTSTAPAQNSNLPTDRVTTTRTTSHNPGTGDTTVTTTNFDTSSETTTAYLSGQMKTSTRTGYATTEYLYTPFTQTQKSGELTTSQTVDLLGRTISDTTPQNGTTLTTYHPHNAPAGARGKTATVTDADGVTTSYGYNNEGELTSTSRLIPLPNGASATQVTQTNHDVVANVTIHGTALGVSLRTTQTISSSATTTASGAIPPAPISPITTSASYRSINGLLRGSVSFGRQTLTISTRPNQNGIATTTTIAPDGTKTQQITTHGLQTSITARLTDHSPLYSSSATYNARQQQITATDSRTGTTTMSNFTEAGQALTTTTPASEVTTTTLDRLGRPIAVKLPDNTFTYTSYHLSGQPAGKWGSLTNPTFTLYDDQGRMLELRTFSNLTAEPTATTTGYAKTTWQYSTTTGHLLSKKDHGEKGASYTYTPAGRLKTRTWARSTAARPQVTTYSYIHGMMTATDYSDTTPDVTITYDLLGRQKTLSNGIATSTFDYNTNNLDLEKETITYKLPGQSPFTRTIVRSQDAIQRSTGYQLNNGTTTEQAVTYRYNSDSGRLGAVSAQTIGSSATQDFIYGYENQSNLIKTTQSFTNYNFSTNTGTGIHQVTNTYEANRNVLLTKANTRASDNSTISSIGYIVNNLGQRTSATRSGAATNSTAWGYDALGQVISADDTNNTADRAYQYDTIGNRKKSAESLTLPDDNNYTTNPLNQYTNIGGSGGYNPTFDEDGNQRNAQIHPTGSSSPLAALYEWDGENRLRSVKNSTGALLVEYHYDAQSRRIATIGHSTGGSTTLHLYDGWNVIAEYQLHHSSFTLHTSNLWGPDLSGSMQGAGGVGGLLSSSLMSEGLMSSFFPCYDGNGNITEYINAGGAIVAHFEYDPFGNTPIITGAQAQEFKYRFSTKPLENTTGLYYYGYRYYHPQTGRWLSRDSVGERGGINLYGFVGNAPTRWVDFLGLCKIEVRYNKLGSISGISWYHAYVVVTDTDGSQTYYRGGPSAGGPSSGGSGATTSGGGGASSDSSGSDSSGSSNSSNSSSPGSGPGGAGANHGPWGPIDTISGPYVPGTIDWNPGAPPSVVVLDNDEPCKCYKEKLQEALDKIQESQTPYNPFGDNSNATAHEIIEDIGLPRPTPPDGVWAPGHGNELTPDFPAPPAPPPGFEVGGPHGGWHPPGAGGYIPYE